MIPIAIKHYPLEAVGVTYAADQPPYKPLPAVRFIDGCVVTRWHLTWWERLCVLFGSGIYHSTLTFNKPIQPMKLGTSFEEVQ